MLAHVVRLLVTSDADADLAVLHPPLQPLVPSQLFSHKQLIFFGCNQFLTQDMLINVANQIRFHKQN